MSIFKMDQQLAVITVTATELLSVTQTITRFIKASEFAKAFSEIIAEINKSYSVLTDSFAPFYELDSEEKFLQWFDEKYSAFKVSYPRDISKPRKYCDSVYDAYIAMKQMKEAKTSFPLIKENFTRLDVLYDKWITNDACLAMEIDGVLKSKSRLLSDIAEMKEKDPEDAYIIFSSAFDDFHDYITFIENKSQRIAGLVKGES